MRRTKEEAAVTRARLLKTALSVFSAKGYSAATMAAFWIALVGGSLLYGFISGLLSPGFGSFCRDRKER